MKQPKISDLKNIDKDMIKCLENWLKNEIYGYCPFGFLAPGHINMDAFFCSDLFDNSSKRDDTGHSCLYKCPCRTYGEEATILAFTIICDVWPVYYGRG